MILASTKYDYYIELLEELTRKQRCTATNVVVCQPRADFLRQAALQVQVRRQSEDATEGPAEPQSARSEGPDGQHSQEVLERSLMTPTLRLLAASRAISLTYCPTIPTLRAWLSSYSPRRTTQGADAPHLVIVDLLALHHGTSEFTLQGLSRTLAAAVSAVQGTRSHLTLTECKDIRDPLNPDRGARLWDRQLPLLSGSVKIGQEGSRWVGRSITARKIAARWCAFESPEQHSRLDENQDKILI